MHPPLQLSKLDEDDLNPEQRERVQPVVLVCAERRDQARLPPHHLPPVTCMFDTSFPARLLEVQSGAVVQQVCNVRNFVEMKFEMKRRQLQCCQRCTSCGLWGMTPALERISGAMMPAAPSMAQRAWITSLQGTVQPHRQFMMMVRSGISGGATQRTTPACAETGSKPVAPVCQPLGVNKAASALRVGQTQRIEAVVCWERAIEIAQRLLAGEEQVVL